MLPATPVLLALPTLPFAHPQAVDAWLENLRPSTVVLGLDNMRTVMTALGHPHDQVPTVHVAGTNGKGSVIALLDSILRAAGLRVGLTISPHLVSVRERIQINRQPCLDADWCLAASAVAGAMAKTQTTLTYFEVLVAMAFWLFSERHRAGALDIALIEVGLGGRLDATNVLARPQVCAITSIGWDHQEWLGDSLAAIAREKAGILKSGVPVVLGPTLGAEALDAIRDVATTVGASEQLVPLGQWASVDNPCLPPHQQQVVHQWSQQSYVVNLKGPYQAHNVATALAVVDELRAAGWVIPEAAVREGLATVTWPGRLQWFAAQRWWVDGSHNVDGMATLYQALVDHPNPLCAVLSMKANRDPEQLLTPLLALPSLQQLIVTSGLDDSFHTAARLAQAVSDLNPVLPVVVCPALSEAITALLVWQTNVPQGEGLVTGSLYTAGWVLGAGH